MTIKVPKKITLKGFFEWIKDNTNCEVRIENETVNVVVFADNIEEGKCVPLFAQMAGDKVMITELCDDYHSPELAWEALEADGVGSYSPVPFYDWVQDQYLTAVDVKVETFSL